MTKSNYVLWKNKFIQSSDIKVKISTQTDYLISALQSMYLFRHLSTYIIFLAVAYYVLIGISHSSTHSTEPVVREPSVHQITLYI